MSPAPTKSECIRFVHACCSLGLFFSSDALDNGCDLRRIIEMGQRVQPWAIVFQVPYHIIDHSAYALPLVVPRAFIMDIAPGALYGMGSRTIRRQPPPLNARRGFSPLTDRFGLLNRVVISHDVDPPHPSLRVGAIQSGPQVTT